MAGDDFTNVVDSTVNDDGFIGLDDEDLAIIEQAEGDSNKVVTRTPQKPYQLGYISVFSIIINKMIGTGIFDNPSTIMHDTRSVGYTLIFWLLGSLATMAGTFVFIEYGLTIPRWEINGRKVFTPRSGGEFNYLNYLVKKPKFLASCMFGIAFILIGNASANALSFASHVLAAAGKSRIYDDSPPADLANLARVIAIATMTGVCFLHGIWRKLGIAINNLFALFKILILLLVIILGFVSIGGTVFGTQSPAGDNFAPNKSFKNAQDQPYGFAQAYLSVVFAFGGFNQANYVLGEIREPRRIYKSATLLAVGTVCVLYMLANIAYMIVVPANIQLQGNVVESFIKLTLGRVSNYGQTHASEILHAFMAVSSLGNVIVSTYTAARVKQEIAKEGILPFSRLIARNYDALTRLSSLFHRRSHQATNKSGYPVDGQPIHHHEKTPLGALLVHWFFALLIILCTWGVTSPQTAYGIVFGIYSYTIDAFMSVAIGVGLLYLRFFSSRTHWNLKSPASHWLSISSASLFVIANLFPIVTLLVPPGKQFKSGYPWWLVPVISLILLVGGAVYWLVFVGVVPKLGGKRGMELKVERTPFFHEESGGELVQIAEVVAYDWVIKN
ncbi:amino acid/polyamine transporter I [Tricladium varicosporioides]|nr:amino acid/polyamine transporter I [Hymenoscyphus varicosporioides]